MLITINIQKRGSEYYFETFAVSGGLGTKEYGPFGSLGAAEAAAATRKSELEIQIPGASISINTIG